MLAWCGVRRPQITGTAAELEDSLAEPEEAGATAAGGSGFRDTCLLVSSKLQTYENILLSDRWISTYVGLHSTPPALEWLFERSRPSSLASPRTFRRRMDITYCPVRVQTGLDSYELAWVCPR